MLALLLSTLIFHAHAETQQQIDPIEPAFAADQPSVGFDSMFREMSQFSNFSAWNSLRAELLNKRLECDLKSSSLERAKKLKKGLISEQEIEAKTYELEVCKLSIELTEKSVENAKASAAYDKFMIVQAGNPGQDFRPQLAEQLKRQIGFEGEQLKINEKIAELARVFQKSRLDRALPLCEKKIRPPTECAALQFEYESALNRQRALAAQSEINSRSLVGLKNSIRRLNDGSAGDILPK
jgi:hypothetical protein